MSKAWVVVLVLFAFSLTTTMINELAIYNTQLNDVGVNANDIKNGTTKFYELSDTGEDNQLIPEEVEQTLSIASLLIKGLYVIGAALKKTVVIYYVLTGYGIAPVIALTFQTMITLIEGVAVVEFALARRISR